MADWVHLCLVHGSYLLWLEKAACMKLLISTIHVRMHPATGHIRALDPDLNLAGNIVYPRTARKLLFIETSSWCFWCLSHAYLPVCTILLILLMAFHLLSAQYMAWPAIWEFFGLVSAGMTWPPNHRLVAQILPLQKRISPRERFLNAEMYHQTIFAQNSRSVR